MSLNLQAFLATLRHCEGTSGPNGYRTMFGGDLFESYKDHPRKAITKPLGKKTITSTAAGAYQFLSRTWDECAKALQLPDFSPESQDRAAIFLIKRRVALEDVEAGRIETALKKCAKEWASLPGSPYGQPTKSLAECLAVYYRAGGSFVSEPKEPMPLPGILAAVLPSLIQAAPALIRTFGDSPQAEKNAKAAEVVAEIAMAATGAPNLQGAAEAIAGSASMKEQFRQAVQERYYELMEAGGGGIAGARDFNLKAAEIPFWKQPAFAISILLLAPLFMLLVDVFYVHSANYSGDLRTQIVTAILAIIGLVGAFWLGSSMSSRAKDEMLARK